MIPRHNEYICCRYSLSLIVVVIVKIFFQDSNNLCDCIEMPCRLSVNDIVFSVLSNAFICLHIPNNPRNFYIIVTVLILGHIINLK